MWLLSGTLLLECASVLKIYTNTIVCDTIDSRMTNKRGAEHHLHDQLFLQSQKLCDKFHIPLSSLPEWHMRRRCNGNPFRMGNAPEKWRDDKILSHVSFPIDDECRDFDAMKSIDDVPAF